ncbi:MAG: histidine phosphotransferase family protein [Pseudomonadota bacterium]
MHARNLGSSEQRGRRIEIDDLALASLLSSRICHDLIGPVAALNNGVEIIEDGVDDDMRGHAFQLIGESARLASAKLQFYRMAFGAGGALADSMNIDELKDLTTGFLEGGRVTLEWTRGESALDRTLAKLLMNLVLIGIETLPRGGSVRVGAMKKGATNLIVVAEGRNATLSDRSRDLLRSGIVEDALQPKEAPLLLTHRLAKSLRAELSFGQENERVVVAATV